VAAKYLPSNGLALVAWNFNRLEILGNEYAVERQKIKLIPLTPLFLQFFLQWFFCHRINQAEFPARFIVLFAPFLNVLETKRGRREALRF
jgi:hypothetical protein